MPTKGMSIPQGNEHQRRWSEATWAAACKKGNYDRSRAHLNFEIAKGGKIQPIDTSVSMAVKFKRNLDMRGIKDPNERLKKPNIRTAVHVIFSGSPSRMHEMAFGDQKINRLSTADNSHIRRLKEIEDWALDMYKFACKKWGEENIFGFYVHLDETTPHIHCSIIPVTAQNKISFKQVFAGENIMEYRKKTTQLHTDLAEVNRPWGLQRGKPFSGKKTSLKQYRQEITEQTEDLIMQLQAHAMSLDDFKKKIDIAQRRVKGLETMSKNLREEKDKLEKEIAALKVKMESEREGLKEKIQWEIDDKMDDLNKVTMDLDEKEEKLDIAIKILEDMNAQISAKKQGLENMQAEFNELTHSKARVVANMMSAAILDELHDTLTQVEPQVLEGIDKAHGDTLFSDFVESGREIFHCAALIFIGNFAKVAAMVSDTPMTGGGGVGSTDLPRKKDDEDERMFARRCFRAAHSLMAPKIGKRKGR